MKFWPFVVRGAKPSAHAVHLYAVKPLSHAVTLPLPVLFPTFVVGVSILQRCVN